MQGDTRIRLLAEVSNRLCAIKIEISQVHAQGWRFGKMRILSLRHGANGRHTANDNDMDKAFEKFGHVG